MLHIFINNYALNNLTKIGHKVWEYNSRETAKDKNVKINQNYSELFSVTIFQFRNQEWKYLTQIDEFII